MKRWISIVLSAAAALMIVGVLGVANADTGPAPAAAPPARVITVNGAGARGVADNAPAAEATAAYGQALADALADAKTKAQALATATGVALGSVQSLVEQSNTPISGCQGGYAMAAEGDAKRTAKPARAPKPARKHPSGKKRQPAKASSRTVAPGPAADCSVDASLTVSYAVTGG